MPTYVYLNAASGKLLANLLRLERINCKTIKKNQMLSQHRSHVFFHVVWDGIYIHLFVFSFFVLVCIFIGYFTDLLHNNMDVIISQIM